LTTPAGTHHLTAETTEKVEREKVRLAYGHWLTYADGAPIALIVTFLMCGFFPEIGNSTPETGAIFMLAVLVWTAGATLIFACYQHAETRYTPLFWRLILTGVWCTHAVLAGSMLFIFWDETNSVNQAILCTVILGVMVWYFFALAMCLEALVPALITVAGVSITAFVVHGDTLSKVFTILLPMFMWILLTYGIKATRSYSTALRLRFENEELAEALARANQAKSAFLASMSHELRTPLNAIIGYTDLMRQRTFGPIAPHRYAAYIEDIHASGQHLLQMINDLLDIAKIEAGKQELVVDTVHLQEVARTAMRLVEPQADRANVGLAMNFAGDALILGDERAIKQVLVNLLSNAVKFSRPGSEAVVFCRHTPDGRLCVGVKDSGVGMTPEVMERVLLPFEQGSDAYTVEGRGTGLGLPICKQLVEAHGGLLLMESTPGVGSTIWAEFPAERVVRQAVVA
jgi:signal transduction histidine kinase